MKITKLVIVMAILALLPATARAVTGGTGLLGTAHDFTQANNPSTTAPVGLCTFCHTPHKALSTLLLWNHTLSTNTFTWADATATTAGTLFPTFKGDTYTGVTAKCLSCHDGSVAIGDVVLFNEAWKGNNSGVVLNRDQHNAADDVFNIGRDGKMAGNHPVAMPYPLNQSPSTYNGVTTGIRIVKAEFQDDPSLSCTTTACIRLFNSDGVAAPQTGTAGLECSSCHDPHNKAAVDDLFLRGKLTGREKSDGYICLQCHIK